MKKTFKLLLLMAVALTGGISLNSCSDDDKEPAIMSPEGTYLGVTTGSSMHFDGLKMPQYTDTIFITPSGNETYTVRYKSPYWGEASFTGVTATMPDAVAAWRFSETQGKILMPYRNPSASGEPTYKEYPATLKMGTISGPSQNNTVWTAANFTIEANLGERAGVYTMKFDTVKE